MSYATRDDMLAAIGEDALVELTDRTDSGVVDDAVLAAALTAADAEIDAYVARVAVLPLPRVPGVLRRIAVSIARWRLSADMADGRERIDYQDALRQLEQIAKGLIDLGLPADGDPPARTRPQVAGVAAPRRTGADLGGDWP